MTETSATTPELRDRMIGSCGAVAVQMSSILVGNPVNFDAVDRSMKIEHREKGASMTELAECARKLGLKPVVAKWHSLPPASTSSPAILSVVTAQGPHYIVIAGYENNKVLVFDFPNGGWVDLAVFERDYRWNGYSLHVTNGNFAYAQLWAIIHQRQVILLVLMCLIAATFVIRRLVGTKSVAQRQADVLLSLVVTATFMPGCGDRDSSSLVPKFIADKVVVSEGCEGYSHGHCPVELEISNPGLVPLTLVSVDASCQCTSVELPSVRVIEPKSSISLPVRVRLPEQGSSDAFVVATLEDSSGRRMQPLTAEITMVGKPLPIPRIVSSSGRLDLDVAELATGFTVYVRTIESAKEIRWIKGLGEVPPIVGIVAEEVLVREIPVRGYEGQIERTYEYKLTLQQGSQLNSGKFPFEFKLPVVANHQDNPVVAFEVSVDDGRRLKCFPSFLMFDLDRETTSPQKKRIWISHGESVQSVSHLNVVSSEQWLQATAELSDAEGRSSSNIGYVDLRIDPGFTPSSNFSKSQVEIRATTEDGSTVSGFIEVSLRSGSEL